MNNDLPISKLLLVKSPSPSEPPTRVNELDESEKIAAQRRDSFQIATNLLLSFKYAGQGVGYAFRTQRNFRIHVIIGAISLFLSVYLQLSAVAFSVVSLMIALVLSLELLNTALEAIVDLTVGREFHQLAKITKDCAAGAVLIAAIASLIIACMLLLPNILDRLMWI